MSISGLCVCGDYHKLQDVAFCCSLAEYDNTEGPFCVPARGTCLSLAASPHLPNRLTVC